MNLQVQKLHEKAKIPMYAHGDDAGFDLCSVEKVTVKSGERVQIKTGLALAVPEGYVGLIWDKSGLSHKFCLKTLGGVVDAGYRGEVMVGVINLGTKPHTFEAGDKVAQMLVQKVVHAEFEEVDTLEETKRADGAFGSTGT